MAGLYDAIAGEVPETHANFKTWLSDMAKRPNPFMDFDVGGLPEDLRSAFYAAAQRAWDRIRGEGEITPSGSTRYLARLLEMRASIERGDPPLSLSDCDEVREYDDTQEIDLSEIWDTLRPRPIRGVY
jgi:hypothetical protein